LNEYFFDHHNNPTSHFIGCLRDSAPNTLKPSLEEYSVSLGQKFFGFKKQDNNHCLQDLIARVDTTDHNFNRCKVCYTRCVAEKSKDLSVLTNYEEFQQWTSPGPDVIDPITGNYDYKCSSECDMDLEYQDIDYTPCLPFTQLVKNYFFDQVTDGNGITVYSKPNSLFTMCLALETTDELQKAITSHEKDYVSQFHGIIQG